MTPRTRRLLVAVLVVGLTVLAVVQFRDQHRARTEAERAELAFEYSQALTQRLDALRAPAQAAAQHVAALRQTLVEHLTVTDRELDAIAADRERLVRELDRAAASLAEAAAVQAPTPPRHLEGTPAAAMATDLAELHGHAAGLSDQLDRLTDAATRWSTSVITLEQRAVEYVAAVADHAPSTDPEELAATWEAERAPLEAYRNAAGLALDVGGLDGLAAAHLRYAESNLDWVDEAAELLAAGDLDTYNARVAELFDNADPFGFAAATTAAAEEALTAGAIAASEDAGAAVAAFLADVTELRRRTPAVLAPPGPRPS